MFHDILERKNAFLEYKILKLKKAKKFARKGRREEENGRLIFIHPIVPCASSPVTSVSLVFRVSLCGNKEALEEDIGNTQSLNDNYRLYSKANQDLLLYKIHYSQEIKIIYYSFLQEPSSKSGVAES